MKDTIDKIIAWFKSNLLVGILFLIVAAAVLFPRQIKKIMGTAPRRKRRRAVRTSTVTRRRTRTRANRKPLPRSVGTARARGKGYAAAGGGTIPFKYNKDGTIKKAWQVGGTLAAKQRMSRLRKNR